MFVAGREADSRWRPWPWEGEQEKAPRLSVLTATRSRDHRGGSPHHHLAWASSLGFHLGTITAHPKPAGLPLTPLAASCRMPLVQITIKGRDGGALWQPAIAPGADFGNTVAPERLVNTQWRYDRPTEAFEVTSTQEVKAGVDCWWALAG